MELSRIVRVLFCGWALVCCVCSHHSVAQEQSLQWDLAEGDRLNLVIRQETYQKASTVAGDMDSTVKTEFHVVWQIKGFRDLEYVVDQKVQKIVVDVNYGSQEAVHAENDESKNQGNVPETVKEAIRTLASSQSRLRLNRFGAVEYPANNSSKSLANGLGQRQLAQMISANIIQSPQQGVTVGRTWIQNSEQNPGISLNCTCREIAADGDGGQIEIAINPVFDEKLLADTIKQQSKKLGDEVDIEIKKTSGEGTYLFDSQNRIPRSFSNSLLIESRVEGAQVVERVWSAKTQIDVTVESDE